MTGVLYMSWRYMLHHRLKTAVLVLSIAIVLYIPLGLRVLVGQGQRQLNARAEHTPLVLGARGSPVELTLSTIYFRAEALPEIAHHDALEVRDRNRGTVVPVYVRFRSELTPIVATTLDYFDARQLRIADGGQMTRLGDCIVGADVARQRRLAPGDHVISSPEDPFDLAGAYPLRMRVTGVIAPTDGPDDRAVFCDLATGWVIAGLAHGHDDLADPAAAAQVLDRDDETIVANASVRQFNEITDDNVDSFHFHGSTDDFPITAAIVMPTSDKAATLLLADYQSHERVQLIRPPLVVADLLDTVLTVQTFALAAAGLVGLAALLAVALVFMLSLRQRAREVRTMMRIGGTRARIGAILAMEVVMVVVAGVIVAIALAGVTDAFGAAVVRRIVMAW